MSFVKEICQRVLFTLSAGDPGQTAIVPQLYDVAEKRLTKSTVMEFFIIPMQWIRGKTGGNYNRSHTIHCPVLSVENRPHTSDHTEMTLTLLH